ncbi:lasso peptide biosynthesis B2 protein [Govanella unica]|uniref:lasso peptide biosynthesis B2 protein n=1 Tax=Govanella unica TaxID=2975056 RepID=UPI003D221503
MFPSPAFRIGDAWRTKNHASSFSQIRLFFSDQRQAMTYFLSPGVHACLSGECLVFLDLKSDRYCSLRPSDTKQLCPLLHVRRDETDPCRSTSVVPDRETLALVHRLRERGLLACVGEQAGRIDADIETPSHDLLSDPAVPGPLASPRDFLNFFLASRQAKRMLEHCSMEEIVETVRTRKAAQPEARDHLETARLLVRIFNKLRPFHKRRYLCLFDSLALLEFLSRYRLYPTWVFGVTMFPFEAHCWIQGNGYVFNDRLDQVRHYSPILAV